MKTILCYGDSNTWGYDPLTAKRYDHKTRWPCILRKLLNDRCDPDDPDYWVVEEGLNGRTSCREDPVGGDKNGLRQLVPILESHYPIDVVVIMLGSNDLKTRFNPVPFDVAAGVQELVTVIQRTQFGPGASSPKILMICPPPTVSSPVFDRIFGNAVEISKELPYYFSQLAQESGVAFMDAGKKIKSSSVDGIHLDPEEHRKLAEAVAAEIRKM